MISSTRGGEGEEEEEEEEEEKEEEVLGIPSVDAFLRSLSKRRNDGGGGGGRGVVVEILGTTSCSGKTHLLYHVCAGATLPVTCGGSRGRMAVVVDCDGRFDVARLASVMRARRAQEADVAEALRHVLVVRPASSAEVVATLEVLEDWLMDEHRHESWERELDCVLVDGISAFYWQDRMDDGAGNAAVERYADTVRLLRGLKRRFGCNVVATNWGLARVAVPRHELGGAAVAAAVDPTGSRPRLVFRNHLPSVWSAFVDVRIVVERNLVRQFAAGISVEEALRERHQRRQVMQLARFTGWIDHSDSAKLAGEGGPATATTTTRASSYFYYAIGKEGIKFD